MHSTSEGVTVTMVEGSTIAGFKLRKKLKDDNKTQMTIVLCSLYVSSLSMAVGTETSDNDTNITKEKHCISG